MTPPVEQGSLGVPIFFGNSKFRRRCVDLSANCVPRNLFSCHKTFSLSSAVAWTKGDRKGRRQLQKSLKIDERGHVARLALVRLLANKADPVAAEVRTSAVVS